ncbi:hypothetical protein ZIOFF_053622 [Zingiber officinale]|uniref:Uncharacterized protein n=1 Tax=Zingiber officinale TaxID=94328 RepID=A0A8J5FGD2_ZINOF|nr:hypothetical protein ZIOFF_053622 [Zingiber officinale]
MSSGEADRASGPSDFKQRTEAPPVVLQGLLGSFVSQDTTVDRDFHQALMSAHTIEGKCVVHTFKNYIKLENVGSEDCFCRFDYKATTGFFTPDRVAVYGIYSLALFQNVATQFPYHVMAMPNNNIKGSNVPAMHNALTYSHADAIQ